MNQIHKRRAFITPLLVTSLLGLSACGSSNQAGGGHTSAFPLTFKRCGRTVTLDHTPRVLVKEPEAAALVAYAGGNMSGKVLAYVDGGYQPIGPDTGTLAKVPVISRSHDLTTEGIVGQKPDLVVAHSYAQASQDQLAAVGVKSMIVNPCCDTYAAEHANTVGFDAIYSDVALMGQLLGTESFAASSVAKMKQAISAVQKDAPTLARHLSKPTAAFTVLINGGFFTYGHPSIANTQIRTLGLTNAFGNLTMRGTQLSAEEFIARDPGVLVIGYESGPGGPAQDQQMVMRRLLSYPGISNLTAVREHHIVILPYNYLLSLAVPGTQLIADQIAGFR